ncbi:MAG: 5'-methylthioadenosine/S-adenosylhomocysteine nucleosidase [bacterium]|nr:5'-methylthioadenosine/S-adenosylhomocysteine nucleosidase [bacterium]
MSRSSLVALLLAFLCLPLQSMAQERPILLLYAFAEEGKTVAASMTVTDRDTVLGREVLIGSASGQRIVLAETGVGMTNAAMTTQAMIDRYSPRCLLLTGIAGGIDTSVHIGDITAPSVWIEHDYGYLGGAGFDADSIKYFDAALGRLTRSTEFNADDSLLAVARQIIVDSLSFMLIGERKPSFQIGGTGVSGNQFIDNIEHRQWLNKEFAALVTDMESAAVAQVCAVNGLPFLIFRSASDLAGGSGSSTADTEIDQFFKVAAHNSSLVVLAMLRQLQQ